MSLIFDTATPVSHVLLFNKCTPHEVRELGRNTRLVSDCYRELLCEDSDHLMELKYRVIIVVPDVSDIASCCEDVCAELKSAGICCHIERIKAEDMFLWQGKVGLLSCVLWCIAGAVLLNDVPITFKQAEKVFFQANRFDHTSHHLLLFKHGWFQIDYKIGLIRSASSIGHLLRGVIGSLHEGHTVSDMLKAMRRNCSGGDLYVAR